MKFTSLRSAVNADVDARAAMAIWPLCDTSLSRGMTYAPPPQHAFLVAVEACGKEVCWRGWIDLEEWLQYVAPDLASLAYGVDVSSMVKSPAHPENVKRLFEASKNPVFMPLPELAYDVLRISAQQEKCKADQRVLSLVTPQGRVWLRDYPNIAAPVRSVVSESVRQIPISIAWNLGSSIASHRLIKKLRRGDVVLIMNESFTLNSANQVIGRFSINVNGEISVQTSDSNGINTPDDFQKYSEMSVSEALNTIPLRLDFILQRRMMTVEEIDSLYRGKVLQLDPRVEREIEIAINGVRIAKGELVEFNGQLGVEIRDISVGKHLDETDSVQ